MLESRRFGKRLAALFLGSSVVLIATGWFYLAHRQGEARAAAHAQLSAVADSELSQLRNWLEERRSDARFFSHARFVAQDVRRFLDEPTSEVYRSAVLHWVKLLQGEGRYEGVAVFDARGEHRLAWPASTSEPSGSVRGLLENARQSRDAVMTDLHQDPTNGLIHLDILFPVFEEADSKRGALLAGGLLKLDARQFIFSLIRSWPTPGRTAETLLVRREGNDVLFLNDLRHRPGASLSLRFAMDTPELAAAKVLGGKTGVFEGIDYRGAPVVATGRLIPQTSWAIVAKVDRAEIYAPLRQQMLVVGLVLGTLLVASALLVGLLWYQRNAHFSQRELALEKEHLAQHKVHEAEIERLNRLYAAMSQVSQAVVRAGSRDELAREVCRVLVQFGGFQMACLVRLDQEGSKFVPSAHFGEGKGYLEKLEVFAGDSPEARCPAGTAVRENRPCICNNLLQDAKVAPWREAAVRSGWRSMAAFPIQEEGETRGALAVYAEQPNFFGSKEESMLAEAASDISFGLEVLLKDQRRKQAEEQLRLQVVALQAAANAIVITDREGVIQWVNTAFERLTGYSASEVAGQTPRVLRSKRQVPGFFKRMWETILVGQVWHGELINQRKDGRQYHEEMTITPVRDARGEITHFIAIKQDVSERKLAEEAVKQAQEELARANAELERKVEERTAQLMEANTSLQTFAYSAAHDLGAPLRAIKGFSSVVLEEHAPQLDSVGQSYLQRVVQSADQMERLLNDLLEYSTLTGAEMKFEKIELSKAVAAALTLLEVDVRAKSAEISVDDSLPAIIGHPATVVLILSNFVSNALKYVARDVSPRIRIRAEVHAPFVRLAVEDNGIGIHPQHLSKLFGIFQRLQGRGEYPGTGLGLAIVKKGAERMGGRVGVESELGQGSRFWVELKAASGRVGEWLND